jgi:hypothetical protein
MIQKKILLSILVVSTTFVACTDWVLAEPLIERRREQYHDEFGYFVYPIATRIAGFGTAYGGGATLVNVAETDVDLTGFYVDGDFQAGGLTALNIHLIPETLILDTGIYNYHVNVQQFNRGMDSDPNDYLLPEVDGQGAIGQLTLTLFDKQLELFTRYSARTQQLLSVRDANNHEYANIDTSKKDYNTLTLGLTLDLTDDHQDPRRGVRFEATRWQRLDDVDPLYSSYHVYDANLSWYIPIGRKNTLAFNYYRSKAVVDRQGSTNFTELQNEIGLDCASIPDASERMNCEATETQFLNDVIAANTYGNASPLGGTQRLRSFVNGRFRAGQTVFYGMEYRWNLTDENTPVDWFILKGRRTNFQLAFFAEAGAVADHSSELNDNLKYSYGTGFRLLFEGVTIRADVANGDEGFETQVFLDYPWSLFSVDRPN